MLYTPAEILKPAFFQMNVKAMPLMMKLLTSEVELRTAVKMIFLRAS